VAEAAPMTEYAIFTAMVIAVIGFAWLWFIEQKKKRKRREALRKEEN
jgi:preprotein translocase subunit YajC